MFLKSKSRRPPNLTIPYSFGGCNKWIFFNKATHIDSVLVCILLSYFIHNVLTIIILTFIHYYERW
ncbi:hypothetical protein HanXRQr2_Chr12g0529571 [Helianthus annuus]|uniref:Uncharacterized protein n=1 Tax=Helianthus annuus TaxID=4232 RepID=A0A9K3ENY2_HELAN|nr:hypothetical protein HanXRQr2_Chr12g0529571 [Helianthus annuus]KAJ0488557.1 hypothetical protein HanHA300_Chr12g0434141 [Helianthus annuus]KAJ0492087.1 hypothetical protein HanIR_Chr12g0570901 [Helianthus annuus]KAJ0504394.1 hypothetical protein HanHA89_Chr12g0458781 [Helianthus annuus]KAJ0674106.1 hypothetical protein HanLR1_Chr12g0436291 [Helianthus annuus]